MHKKNKKNKEIDLVLFSRTEDALHLKLTNILLDIYLREIPMHV